MYDDREIFKPRINERQFLFAYQVHAHQRFVAQTQVVAEIFLTGFDIKLAQRFADRAVIEIARNFVPEIAHQAVLVPLLPNRGLLEKNGPIVGPSYSLRDEAPPDISHAERAVTRKVEERACCSPPGRVLAIERRPGAGGEADTAISSKALRKG